MNLPNRLTVFRMILVPLIVVCYLFPYEYVNGFPLTWSFFGISFSVIKLIVLIIFVIASLTDYFDGKIARDHGLITTFGKFMDPIADKLLVNTVLILLAYDGTIPVICAILMISRDTFVDSIRMIAMSKNIVMAAGFLGKLKTVLQMIAIIISLIGNFPFSYIGLPADLIMVWAATCVSIISGIDYFKQAKHLILESI